jgi:glutathione-specific gamma-glutamylcyclotransferase
MVPTRPVTSGAKIPLPEGQHQELSKKDSQFRLDKTRAGRPDGPLWVFAFGSLMWNPCFEYDRADVAVLPGWERKFHIWTTVARGTPERPGLGLCLEKGNEGCKGIVYQLRAENEDQDWAALWYREMSSGIYQTLWTDVETENSGRVKALAFVVDRDHRQYAGPLPAEMMAEIMAGASGRYGRCRDYLAGTVEEMGKLGVSDPDLLHLLKLVDSREIALSQV